jgi:hypothetical protein
METPEPVVRLRCPDAPDEERCRAILERSGLRLERQLTWLVVRDADPDRVNELLVAGGAIGRVAAREQVGKLLGFVLDHGGRLAGREASLRSNVARVIATSGLERRWTPRPDPELVVAAARLHEWLMASGAGFVSWERFLELFCRPAPPGPAGAAV